LEAAHRAKPDDFETLMQLNQAFQTANGGFTPSRMVQYLDEYVRRHPRSTRGLMELGILTSSTYSVLGYERAERCLGRLVAQEPRNAEAIRWLGVAFLYGGKFQQALDAFRREQALDPAQKQVGFWIAATQERMGDPEAALATAVPLLEVDPTATLRFFIHRLHQEARRPERALPAPARYHERGYHRAESVLRFTDVAQRAGMTGLLNGRGSGWADYDGDGFLDLVVASSLQPLALWHNNGDGTFTNVAEKAGLAQTPPGWCTLWADYDNDGRLDLFVGRNGWGGPQANSLFHNNGDGTFTDVAQQAGVADPRRACFTAAWADYNGDGRLDLYVSNFYGAPNVLYHNNGDGTFTDVTARAGVGGHESSIGCAWGDYDGDGRPDLYVVNLSADNTLYHNNGDGTFTDVTRRAGVAEPFISYAAMWLDYDNDGRPDLFVSGFCAFYQHALWLENPGQIDFRRSNRLYRNRGDGTFEDVSRRAGVAGNYGAMAASVGDVDNDGFEDLYLGCGGPDFGRIEESVLFRNDGHGHFQNISKAAGAGYLGKVHGVSFADYDNDGWMDLYLPAGAVHAGDAWPPALYHNGGGKNHWLLLRLRGVRSNRDAIGARVRLQAGPHVVYREVSGGCGFGVTNQRDLQLGLGTHTRVDRLDIAWPGGRKQQLRGLPADTAGEVVEGEAGWRVIHRPRFHAPRADARREAVR
jgi:tetratricopeptide (TPR) repeat protein